MSEYSSRLDRLRLITYIRKYRNALGAGPPVCRPTTFHAHHIPNVGTTLTHLIETFIQYVGLHICIYPSVEMHWVAYGFLPATNSNI